MNNIEILENKLKLNEKTKFDWFGEKEFEAIENLIQENKELKKQIPSPDNYVPLENQTNIWVNKRDYIPKSKVKELLEEIKKEKNVAITKMLNEDYHLAENGAVCQTLDYIEGRIEKLLED